MPKWLTNSHWEFNNLPLHQMIVNGMPCRLLPSVLLHIVILVHVICAMLLHCCSMPWIAAWWPASTILRLYAHCCSANLFFFSSLLSTFRLCQAFSSMLSVFFGSAKDFSSILRVIFGSAKHAWHGRKMLGRAEKTLDIAEKCLEEPKSSQQKRKKKQPGRAARLL